MNCRSTFIPLIEIEQEGDQKIAPRKIEPRKITPQSIPPPGLGFGVALGLGSVAIFRRQSSRRQFS